MPGPLQELLKFLTSPVSFSGWPGGFYASGPLIFSVPALATYLCLFVVSLVWAYLDATKRGKSGWLILLMILLTGWPFSFVWWFWLRPPLPVKVAA